MPPPPSPPPHGDVDHGPLDDLIEATKHHPELSGSDTADSPRSESIVPDPDPPPPIVLSRPAPALGPIPASGVQVGAGAHAHGGPASLVGPLPAPEQGHGSAIAASSTNDLKAELERGANAGTIDFTFNFAATALTHPEEPGCVCFVKKVPNTTQQGFSIFEVGAHCMVSAEGAPNAHPVDKAESYWRADFPGEGAGRPATGMVDGKEVELIFFAATWKLTCVLASPPRPSASSD